MRELPNVHNYSLTLSLDTPNPFEVILLIVNELKFTIVIDI
jgi:hypothetical protein